MCKKSREKRFLILTDTDLLAPYGVNIMHWWWEGNSPHSTSRMKKRRSPSLPNGSWFSIWSFFDMAIWEAYSFLYGLVFIVSFFLACWNYLCLEGYVSSLYTFKFYVLQGVLIGCTWPRTDKILPVVQTLSSPAHGKVTFRFAAYFTGKTWLC